MLLGKTTTFKMLIGEIRANSGTAVLCGKRQVLNIYLYRFLLMKLIYRYVHNN